MEQPASQRAWRDQQLAALRARLEPIRRMRDGTIYTEPSGIHFHVLTKSASALCFWLVEQSNPSTGVIQSEIDLDDPLALVEPYTQAMTLGLLWQPQPRSIYLAGLGGGRLALVLYHALPDATIHATEIDPEIVAIARRYFGLPDDARIAVTIEDGRVYLERRTALHDLILVDVFLDNGYSPYRLATREFYALCRSRLRPGGVVVTNLLAGDSFLADKIKTVLNVFPQVWQFTVAGDNTVLIATDAAAVDAATLRGRARASATTFDFAFPFADCADALMPARTDLNLATAHVLTDAQPPPGYFDTLPSFATPFSNVAGDLPCPCGSGLRYDACHGRSH
jgi:spermidine synthase